MPARRGAARGASLRRASGPRRRRWRRVPHTADIAVALSAPTLTGLFDAAAEALLALGAGHPERVEPRRRLAKRVQGAGPEDLLVRWLQEILFRQETRRWRFGAARVAAIDRKTWRLRGTASGETYDAARHGRGREIKAVTYHRLAIRRRAGRYHARLVFDV